MTTASQKLRKQIDALIGVHNALCKLNVSDQAIDSVLAAVEELEDAYIAEVNHENATR